MPQIRRLKINFYPQQLRILTERNESLNTELISCQEELNNAQSRLQSIQVRKTR